jgi:hypothetical protein
MNAGGMGMIARAQDAHSRGGGARAAADKSSVLVASAASRRFNETHAAGCKITRRANVSSRPRLEEPTRATRERACRCSEAIMAIKIQPLTKKQLAEIVECYATVFPDWEIVSGQVFSRTSGPICQLVGIEALRSGAYRPWAGVRAVPVPDVRMLHQFLDIKHRQILPRQHPVMWKNVVAAMEQQFRPSIRKQLDLAEIKGLCEQEARPTTNDLCMLATLSAYLGEKQQALSCCEQMENVEPPVLAPRLDWERRHLEFGRQLRQAIEAGNVRQFLDAVPAPA